jgi:hypothetical protein
MPQERTVTLITKIEFLLSRFCEETCDASHDLNALLAQAELLSEQHKFHEYKFEIERLSDAISRSISRNVYENLFTETCRRNVDTSERPKALRRLLQFAGTL